MTQIIALCGKINSGKTTISQTLCHKVYPCKIKIEDPIKYICNIIGEKDYNKIIKLLSETIDPEIENKLDKNLMIPEFPFNDNTIERINYSFSLPLKLICSVLSNTEYEYFIGDNCFRNEREIITIKNLKYCEGMTRRKFMNYVGTNIFREKYGENIWVDIFEKNIYPNYNYIVIDDLRFKNEYNCIKKLKGEVFYVKRKNNMNDTEYEMTEDFVRKENIQTINNCSNLNPKNIHN